MKSLVFSGLILALIFVTYSPRGVEGLHAECNIEWTWNVNCSDVRTALLNQIKAWNNTNCNNNEKCRYALISTSSDNKIIKATHTTPVRGYVDDLTFTFDDSKTGVCNLKGYSTSEVWYAVLDDGTNYCNLHNLITGAGLDKKPGYKETTSISVCTQYSSADCDKY